MRSKFEKQGGKVEVETGDHVKKTADVSYMLIRRILGKYIKKNLYLIYFHFFREIGELEGLTLVDVKCGNGNYLIEALNRGAAYVTGFENSLDLILQARERLHHGTNRGKYTLLQENPEEAMFFEHDYAIAVNLMHSTGRPLEILKKLHKSVRISAFVSFPVKYRLSSVIWLFLNSFKNRKFHAFSRKEIIKMGYAAGFRDVKIIEVRYPCIEHIAVLKKEAAKI